MASASDARFLSEKVPLRTGVLVSSQVVAGSSSSARGRAFETSPTASLGGVLRDDLLFDAGPGSLRGGVLKSVRSTSGILPPEREDEVDFGLMKGALPSLDL